MKEKLKTAILPNFRIQESGTKTKQKPTNQQQQQKRSLQETEQ